MFFSKYKSLLDRFSLLSLKPDVIAGLSVGVVAIPQALAYASIAGLPPVYGLFACFLPAIVAAIAGSSKYLSTGPVAIVSLLTFSAVSPFATPLSENYIALAAILALMVGIIQLFLSFLKMGSLIRYVAHPVLVGFSGSAAIIIALSQFSKISGYSIKSHGHTLLDFIIQLQHFHEFHMEPLVIGLISLVAIKTVNKLWPRLPGVLMVVAGMTLLNYYLRLPIDIVGKITLSVPKFLHDLPSIKTVSGLFIPALTISLVGYLEGVSIAKSIARRAKENLHPGRELFGQGLGNLAAGLSGTGPVAGSFSRTALNYASGAKSYFSSITLGLLVLLTLIFLTPLFYYLPQATLAIIIMIAITKLIHPKEISQLLRSHPRDGVLALITFIVTLASAPHLNYGLLLGILASIFLHMHKIAKPLISAFVLDSVFFKSNSHFNFNKYPTNDKVLVVVTDTSINFANAEHIKEEILDKVGESFKIRYVLILGRGINHIDATGEDTLENLREILKTKHVKMIFSGLTPTVIEHMKKTQLYRHLGAKYIFHRANLALKTIYLWEKQKRRKRKSRSREH